MAQHPQVVLPRDQALHFFDKEENFVSAPNYKRFHQNFPRAWPDQIAGEVTADYLYYPQALERIARYNPQMKLIVSLRNPTERAFSHWNMRRAKSNESLDFIDAIKRDLSQLPAAPRGNAHIDRGLYFSQIERVFRLFPREQVLILEYEDLRANHSAIVDLMFDFIGLPRMPAIENKRRNVGPYERKMSAEERAYVSPFFHEDITKLEALLGWDCRDWRGDPG